MIPRGSFFSFIFLKGNDWHHPELLIPSKLFHGTETSTQSTLDLGNGAFMEFTERG